MPGKGKTRNRYLVFISHSEKDRWIATQIANLIGKTRVRTFLYEKDVQGGQSIPDTIRAHIEECNEFLVLLSRYSVSRPWVLSELGAAWGLRKPIVAIIDKISPKEMPDIVFPFKAIDLNEFDQYLKELAKRTRRKR